MERVKITICGRDFNLKVDDPERLKRVAKELQERINRLQTSLDNVSITDLISLVALDIADESDKARSSFGDNMKKISDAALELNSTKDSLTALRAEKEKLSKDINITNKQLKELKERLSDESKKSEELSRLRLSDLDRIKLLEKERDDLEDELLKALENNSQLEAFKNAPSSSEELLKLTAEKEDLEKRLEELENSISSSTGQQIQSQTEEENRETERLKHTISCYEKSFEEYMEERNKEVVSLQDELQQWKKKYSDLNEQMNEILDDGQLTL